ncbi:MAG: serine hydrolase, partial [Planctomycetes bacterium]|nr:serine hydrolase [Planctomycetota bacterium]
NGKDKITGLQLLTHQGGLIPDNPIRDYQQGRDEAMKRVLAVKPVAAPGERFIYSDVGFIVLAELVRRVTGKNVHQFSQTRIFKPLGMTETGYLPAADLRKRAAVTQQRDGRWMQGEVHDPRAHRLGGIAGHAGLFSTANDLAVYAQMMLGGGTYRGVRILKPKTVELMTRPVKVPSGLRALGWDSRVLVQRLLRCTRVTEDALRFAFRRRDLTGAEQVHRDTSVEIVQLAEFQCPCFLGRIVRLNKLTIRAPTSLRQQHRPAGSPGSILLLRRLSQAVDLMGVPHGLDDGFRQQ